MNDDKVGSASAERRLLLSLRLEKLRATGAP
jgi:hypothetical protein